MLKNSSTLNFQRQSPLMKALVFLTLMFGVVGAAFAQAIIDAPGGRGTWTVYGFGNAQAVSDTFRALANFASSSMFRSLVLMLGIIGVVVVGVSSGFNGQMARKFVGYIMGVMLTVYVLFGFTNNGQLQVRVEVMDVVDGTWKAPVNVPAVVGIPASLISQAGFEVMRQIEASFPIPDGLKMSQGAPFNLATALINDASKAKITDPDLSSSLAMYVQDCFIPAVARGEKDPKILINSTNFLEELRISNVALLVNTFLPTGKPELVSCQDAYTRLKTVFDADGNASSYLTSASAYAGTSGLSVVNSAADYAASWAQHGSANGSSTNGGTFVKQAAVLASFTGAFRQTAAQTGNSDFLTGLAVTQATEGQKNSWVVGAEVFNRMMGYILAVLQVFVYAITPLILAASLIPSLGAALLKNFMQILLWLAIWQPMLAIVNFIIVSMQFNDLNGILGGSANFGFTLSNMAVVSEKTSNMRAAATFVGTMVPALAWAMVKGSLDFSRIIGSAVGESFAQGASNTLTTGNFSLNNGSMDSFTANKQSLGQNFDAGRGFSLASSGGINNKNELGGNFNPSSGDTNAGVAARQDFGAGSAASNSNMTAAGNTAAHTQGGGSSHAVTRNTTDGVSGVHADTSGLSRSLGANAAVNGRLAVLRGSGGGGGGAGGGAPSAAPGDQNDGDKPPKSKREWTSGPLSTDISGGVTASVVGSQSGTDTHSRAVGDVSGASRQINGTDNHQTTETASTMGQAARTEQATRNQGLTITTLAPGGEQAAVHAQALNFKNSRFAPKSVEGSLGNQLFYNQAPTTDVGRAAQELSTSGHVVNRVGDLEKKADSKMGEHRKEEEGLEAQAKARAAAAQKASEAQMAADAAKVAGTVKPALTRPSERASKAVGELMDRMTGSEEVKAVGPEGAEALKAFSGKATGFAANMGDRADIAAAPPAAQRAQPQDSEASRHQASAPARAAGAPQPAATGPQPPEMHGQAQQQHAQEAQRLQELQQAQQAQQAQDAQRLQAQQAQEAQRNEAQEQARRAEEAQRQAQAIQQAALGQTGMPVGTAQATAAGGSAAAATMALSPVAQPGQQPAQSPAAPGQQLTPGQQDLSAQQRLAQQQPATAPQGDNKPREQEPQTQGQQDLSAQQRLAQQQPATAPQGDNKPREQEPQTQGQQDLSAPPQQVIVQQNVTQVTQQVSEPASAQGQTPQPPSEGIQLTEGGQAPAQSVALPSPPRSSSGSGRSNKGSTADDDGPADMPSQTTGSVRPPSR